MTPDWLCLFAYAAQKKSKMTYRTKRCRSDYGRREALNKEFERCCRFLAEMMEKYGALVLRDIAVEIQYEPETWCDDAEGKRLRYEAYARRVLKRFEKAA